jgi:hypothetical protein
MDPCWQVRAPTVRSSSNTVRRVRGGKTLLDEAYDEGPSLAHQRNMFSEAEHDGILILRRIGSVGRLGILVVTVVS